MATDLKVDTQRLFDLARQLELEDATAALAELTGEAQLDHCRAAGRRILRELDARQAAQLPPIPGATEKWGDVVPILEGLEQMSRGELRHLGELANQARDGARALVASLPATWRARCRTDVAETALTSDDPGWLTQRLRRRMAQGVRAVGRGLARQLHHDLLGRLSDAVDHLYPLACTADQMIRAMEHQADAGKGSDTPSLVERLAGLRCRWRETPSPPEPDDAESAGHSGALLSAFGGEAVAVALETLAPSDLPSGAGRVVEVGTEAGRRRFKEAALESARTVLGRQWRTRRQGILEAVDAHVAERFHALQREIDGWLEQARVRLSALCGVSTEPADRLEAIRFEVLDICLLNEGATPTEAAP